MDDYEKQRQAVMETIKRHPRLDQLVTRYLRGSEFREATIDTPSLPEDADLDR